jgi:uncharacterized protein YecE (DUF72 family)
MCSAAAVRTAPARGETIALLAEHGTAYCVMSGANLPCVLRVTAGFVYVRMHGPDDNYLYAGSYPDADLNWWADRIREWSLAGQDIYVYFNNDGKASAVRKRTDAPGVGLTRGGQLAIRAAA